MPTMRAWDGTQWVTLPAASPAFVAANQAVNVSFTPAGSIAASNVQAAVEEVATDYIAADSALTAAYQAADALRPTSATLAASGGSALIGFVASGGTATTVQSELRRIINVRMYGATGNGTTDDTAAINAAFAALNNADICEVYFPAGTYRTTAQLVVTNKKVHIRGAGQGATVIKCEMVSGICMSVANTDYTQFATVEGITFTTNQVNSVTGLYVEFATADATNNRIFDRCTLRDLQFLGSVPGVVGWQKGIDLVNVHAASLMDININGATYAASMVAGVSISNISTGAPADITFRNVKVYYGLIGFKGTGHLEGINFSQCFAIACAVGWDFRLSSEFPWFVASQCHANVTQQGFHLENFSQSWITNNLIYIVNQPALSTPVGISLDACNDTIVSQNNIVNPIAVGGTTVVGVFNTNSQRNKIVNNKVAGFDVGYWIQGTSDFTRTYDNEVSSGYVGNIAYHMTASGGSNTVRNTP